MKCIFSMLVLSSLLCQTAHSETRLMQANREEGYRKLLPAVEDQRIREVMSDPSTLLYTRTEMPQAYEFNMGGGDLTFHDVNYNISNGAAESSKGNGNGGNGGVDFPWRHPGGTDFSPNNSNFKFISLPKRSDGTSWPVVWWRGNRDGLRSYSWMFPVGTVFGEVLTLKSPEGHDYTYEMRIRTRRIDGWSIQLFRPCPTAQELSKQIKELRPNWESDPELVSWVKDLESAKSLPSYRRRGPHPNKVSFDVTEGIDYLPDIKDKNLIKSLLKQPFKNAEGGYWKQGTNQLVAYAPTTTSSFQIVPKQYFGTLIGSDSQSCMKCHESAATSVRAFDAGRDWYGFVPGCDGILSFHIADPNCISGNGYGTAVQLRKSFIDGGVLEAYDTAKHPDNVYHRISGLKY